MMAFRRVVFALTGQIKAQARISPSTKARESSQKEKARKKLILSPDFQPPKHLKKKDIVMPGNLMTGLPVSGLGRQLLDGKARKPTLLGWQSILFESCPPSDTRGSGSRLHTIQSIEISNRKISECFLVLWYSDRILSLQQILRVRKLRNRNLFGKLHYSLFNNTTMFNHG